MKDGSQHISSPLELSWASTAAIIVGPNNHHIYMGVSTRMSKLALLQRAALENVTGTMYHFWDDGFVEYLPATQDTCLMLQSFSQRGIFVVTGHAPFQYEMYSSPPGSLSKMDDIIKSSFFGGSASVIAWLFSAYNGLVQLHPNASLAQIFSTLALRNYHRVATIKPNCLSGFLLPSCVTPWATSFRCNATEHAYVHTGHEFAVTTMLTSRSYIAAVQVLGNSLRHNVNTSSVRMLLGIYADYNISNFLLERARAAGWELCYIPRIPNPPYFTGKKRNKFSSANLFSKLAIWSWTQFERVVWLDSDMIVIKPLVGLFYIQHPFAACRNFAPGDSITAPGLDLNSGMLSVKPSFPEFVRLLQLMMVKTGYDTHCGEQSFFSSIYAASMLELPWVFNAQITICYFEPDWWYRHDDEIRVIHYTVIKPWTLTKKLARKKMRWVLPHMQPLIQLWWHMFNQTHQPRQKWAPLPYYKHE